MVLGNKDPPAKMQNVTCLIEILEMESSVLLLLLLANEEEEDEESNIRITWADDV